MRRSLPILLVVLLVYQSMGYLWVFEGRMAAWRHMQWEHLEEQLRDGRREAGVTTILVTDLAALDWREEGKEFMWQGALYDLLRMEPTADGWELHAIADAVESQLKHDFTRLQSGDSPDPSGMPLQNWSRLLAQSYLAPAPAVAKLHAHMHYPLPRDWRAADAPFLELLNPPPAAGALVGRS